jgi:signal transduction histidine kinase
MNIRRYLLDQRWLFLTVLTVISFAITIIMLDPTARVHITSLIYVIIITSVIISIYLAYDYTRKKTFVSELVKQSQYDEYLSLPNPSRQEEQIYIMLLQQHLEKHINQMEMLNKEKKEWLEYMTSWFHEIKTPIAVSKMIYETQGSAPSLEEEMDKIEHFVDQALYFSRMNDFNLDYLIQEIDAAKVIKEAVKLHTKTFLSKQIKLNLEVTAFEVLTDKKGLLFILNQLLSNALKYTGTEGEVTIRIVEKDRKILVRDNGIGIAAEDLPRVFQTGFTGKNGRNHHASTGMGLYLTKKMGEKLGHEVLITSKQREYTEASIHFPESADDYYMNSTL